MMIGNCHRPKVENCKEEHSIPACFLSVLYTLLFRWWRTAVTPCSRSCGTRWEKEGDERSGDRHCPATDPSIPRSATRTGMSPEQPMTTAAEEVKPAIKQAHLKQARFSTFDVAIAMRHAINNIKS
ncbi:hypothetical protein BHM03_00013365 [Ensete ventricosum]|nr:hypothetical protein BHM03_00013365 [Ensete ventricosum]